MKKHFDYKFKSTRDQLYAMLEQDAQLVQAVAKTVCVTLDMETVIKRFKDEHELEMKDIEKGEYPGGRKYTEYVAIRDKGVEDGGLEYVKERCSHLGEPVVVYKIEFTMGSEEAEVVKRIIARD